MRPSGILANAYSSSRSSLVRVVRASLPQSALEYRSPEDVVEDVVRRVLAQVREGNWPIASAEAGERYLRRAVRNEVIDVLRRKSRCEFERVHRDGVTTADPIDRVAAPGPGPRTGALRAEHTAEVDTALALLTPYERRVFELAARHQLPHRTVAIRLNRTERAVRAVLMRARRKLAAALSRRAT